MVNAVADAALVDAVRSGLAELADPAKAQGMQAYMKSDLPFRGVQKPLRAMLATRLFAEHPLSDVDTWTATVRELWHRADYREERYVAIDLTGGRRYLPWQTPQLVPLYRELIVTGAWWDYVDEIANRRVGPLLRGHPDQLTPVMRAWAVDADPWLRRTSIICQLGSKGETDLDLLAAAIEANLGQRDFFLRKAIGWALREHSKTDPGWVRQFVATHPGLSALSVKEAGKYL